MRIYIVGAGAMGSFYGGRLKLNGCDVTLIDVSKDHIDAINQRGLLLETDGGSYLINIPARFASEIERKADLIILFTKTYHTKSALESIRHLINDDTYVLTLQNGLGNVEKINEFFDLSKIIVGITTHPSEFIAPGHIRSFGSGITKIISADGKMNYMLDTIYSIFNSSGLPCEISLTIYKDIWKKLAFNVALNSIGCVTYLTNGGIGSTNEGRLLVRKVIEEVVSVANKKGIDITVDEIMDSVENAIVNHKHHLGSMLQDVLAKRPTEIDTLNGAVVNEAKRLGMAVPTVETLYYLVKIQEQTFDERIRNLR